MADYHATGDTVGSFGQAATSFRVRFNGPGESRLPPGRTWDSGSMIPAARRSGAQSPGRSGSVGTGRFGSRFVAVRCVSAKRPVHGLGLGPVPMARFQVCRGGRPSPPGRIGSSFDQTMRQV